MPTELPRLPPELIGEILAKAGLPYRKRVFDECGFSEDVRQYAMTSLRREEAEWTPLIDWIRGVLTRVRRVTREKDGHPNRFATYEGGAWSNTLDRLLSCWPRYWYFDDLHDGELDQYLSLDEETSAAIGGEDEYSFHASRDSYVQLEIFNEGSLHSKVSSAKLRLCEWKTDYAEMGETADTVVRSLEVSIRFVDGEKYTVQIQMEQEEFPDGFELTLRMGRLDHLTHFMVFLRALLSMEQPPYLTLKYNGTYTSGFLKAAGLRHFGVQL